MSAGLPAYHSQQAAAGIQPGLIWPARLLIAILNPTLPTEKPGHATWITISCPGLWIIYHEALQHGWQSGGEIERRKTTSVQPTQSGVFGPFLFDRQGGSFGPHLFIRQGGFLSISWAVGLY